MSLRLKLLLAIVLILFVFLYLKKQNDQNSVEQAMSTANALQKVESASAGSAEQKQNENSNPEQITRTTISFDDYKSVLEKKYNTKLQIEADRRQKPFRLSGQIKWPNPERNNKERIWELINDVSLLLEIDRPEQLKETGKQKSALGEVLGYEQVVEGIQVEGSQVRIHLNASDDPFMINSTYQSGVDASQINRVPEISADEAIEAAITHARSLDPDWQNPSHAIQKPQLPVLVIYKFRQIDRYDIAWRILISQPWLGPTRAVGRYFVNAHQPKVLERIDRTLE